MFLVIQYSEYGTPQRSHVRGIPPLEECLHRINIEIGQGCRLYLFIFSPESPHPTPPHLESGSVDFDLLRFETIFQIYRSRISGSKKFRFLQTHKIFYSHEPCCGSRAFEHKSGSIFISTKIQILQSYKP